MEVLSKDILSIIFSFLSLRDTINFSETSKYWNNLINTKPFVFDFFFRKYFPKKRGEEIKTKLQFLEQYRKANSWRNKEMKPLITKISNVSNLISLTKGQDGSIYFGNFDSTIRSIDKNHELRSEEFKLDENATFYVPALERYKNKIFAGFGHGSSFRGHPNPLCIFSTENGELKLEKQLIGGNGRCVSIDFDDELLIAGCWDCSVSVWNQKDYSPVTTLIPPGDVEVSSVHLTEEYIISAHKNGKIHCYHRKTFTLDHTLEGHEPTYILGLGHYNNIFASVSSSPCSSLKLWDMNDGFKLLHSIRLNERGLRKVWLDEFKILVLGREGILYVLDHKAQILREIQVSDQSLRAIHISGNKAYVASRGGLYKVVMT